MAITTLRGARRAAPLALALATACALSACSGGPKAAAQTTAGSPAPSVSNDPRATAVLVKAASTLATEKSFRFDATETVAAKTPTTSNLAGAVVRDQGVTYTLTVGRTTTQVVRIKGATYVRKVPGRWAKLVKPRPVTDPTASLRAILTGLADTSVATASLGAGTATTTVAGTLSATAARSAGIPVGAQPAQVTVSVDPAGHVTRVTVHTTTSVGTQAGTSAVTVTLVTSYTAFDRVPALRAPR
jgi:hypothetical protein